MKLLHLFSDWKWTGPADPVVSLCEHLAALGVDVSLAFRQAPSDFKERAVGKEAAKRGVPTCGSLRLNRYFSFRDWLYDVRAIHRYAVRTGVDIVHSHLTHDHSLAMLSLFGRRTRPILVRTDHKRDGLEANFSMGRLLARTDGLVTYSKRIMDLDVAHHLYPIERCAVLPPGVKVYDGPVQDLKEELGVKPDERVIGVIGRLKPDRGYDVILNGFKLLRERVDRVKLVIVGRSSQIEESIKKPLAELGLERDVILAGYRLDDYFSMISTFDLFVMMRAGSDGTARALREVMAMGRPAIVSDRGMLPDLVEEGKDGFVVNNAQELASRMEQILVSDELRLKLGEAARIKARQKWDYAAQAAQLVEFYERLLTMGKR